MTQPQSNICPQCKKPMERTGTNRFGSLYLCKPCGRAIFPYGQPLGPRN